MKCVSCGITIPEMTEDATEEEQLCDLCYGLDEEERSKW